MIRVLVMFAATFATGWLLGAAVAHIHNVLDVQRDWNRHVRDALDVLDQDR